MADDEEGEKRRPDGARTRTAPGAFELAGALFAAFAAAAALRLLEWPAWREAGLFVSGEPLLSAHDGYHWLSLAVSSASDVPAPAAFLRFVSRLTGAAPAQAAFWSPPFLAALTAPVLVLWCRRLGAFDAWICAALWGASAPGFFLRSRLGYFDTDPAALAVPLLASLLLASGLGGLLRPGFSSPCLSPALPARPASPRRDILLTALAGLCIHFGTAWHAHIRSFGLVLLATAGILAALRAQKGQGGEAARRICLFGALGVCGTPGLFLAPLCLAPVPRRFARPGRAAWIWGAAAAALAAGIFLGTNVPQYLRPVLATQTSLPALGALTGQTGPYLDPLRSVAEAQRAGFYPFLHAIAPFSFAAMLGICGFALVAAVRAEAALLFPLALFAAGSMAFGARSAMFGGPVAALGLGVPVCWAAYALWRGKPWRRAASFLLQAAMGAALLAPLSMEAWRLPPQPALSKELAAAMMTLRGQDRPDARIWIWWDYGYAARYYSGLTPFAHGGSLEGPRIALLSRVFMADAPERAAMLMRRAQDDRFEPTRTLEEAQGGFFSGSATPHDAQYLIVQKRLLDSFSWISLFASTSPGRDTKERGEITRMHPPLSIDVRTCSAVMKDGKTARFQSILDIQGTQQRRCEGELPDGTHLVRVDGDAFVMDDAAYSSALVTLLFADPSGKRVSRDFRIVQDGWPQFRIYTLTDDAATRQGEP